MALLIRKSHNLGLILGICYLQISLAQRSIDLSIQQQIDDFATNIYLPYSNISSMGLTIVKDNGKILYTTGYGYADHAKGIANGNQTQFLIGSVTKSFTATVIIKVLNKLFPEMGESVVDTPIRKLIPSANFTLIDRFRSEYATFRDLLSHRTCILKDDLQLLSEPFPTTSEIVYRQRYADEMCGIRTQFQYNNQMYVIAGELIGILANKSYTELVNEFLEEIGMYNSALGSKSDDFSNMPFRGQPYYVIDNVSYPMNTDLIKRVVVNNAAGGLYATMNDMAKYLQFRLNKGNVDGKQIVPQNTISWMTKTASVIPVVPFKKSEGDIIGQTYGYGLGLVLSAYDGWEYVAHGGYFPTYHSLMSLFPGQNLGIFTSTNEGPALVEATVLHTFIFELLRGKNNATEVALKEYNSGKTIKNITESMTKDALEKFLTNSTSIGRSQNSSDVTGKYGSGVSGDVKVVEKFNNQTNAAGLYVSYGKWYKGWLEYIGGSTYQINWVTDVIQDNYAQGQKSGLGYLRIQNETLEFLAPSPAGMAVFGKFKLGVSLDILPIVPWTPNSCGPKSVDTDLHTLNEIS